MKIGKNGAWDTRIHRAASLCVLCLVLGCGGVDESAGRASVQGSVTLDGEPVRGGTLNFMGRGDGQRNASVRVEDGRYEIPKERGPNLGKYRVEVYWKKPVGLGDDADELAAEGDVQMEERIPSQFNENSTLEVEIVAGENVHNFDLKSN